MRKTFVNTLIELAEKDKDIYLLTGDLGFSLLEDFAKKFPKRFINCGVAEQNMMTLAAGLALAGKKPYVYSIIPFATMKCFEQIRNDVAYQNVNVKIVGVGSGFAYGHLGCTHHSIEDIAIIRSLPNMAVLSPADPLEAKELILKSYSSKSPTYLRLHKSGDKVLYNFTPNIEIGKPSVLVDGDCGLIIATGTAVGLALEVAGKLKSKGYNFKLLSQHTLKPIMKEFLLNEIAGKKVIVAIEEHNIIGGLGSLLAEILAESDWHGKFKRFGVPDKFCSKVGGEQYLRNLFGLTVDNITERILEL